MSQNAQSAEVIVIGAGMGGLACAARLARAGVNTLLLEQDRRVGGTAGGFFRSGFSFPTGPVGVTGPDYIDSVLKDCGARELPEWARSHFRLVTEGLNLVISQPLEHLASELIRLFPAEARGIELLTEGLLKSVRTLRAGQTPEAEILGGGSAEAHVRKFLRDERLVRLFASQGTEPPSSSWPVMIRMWDFLSESGIWYPSCGVHGLPLLLKEAFRGHGGRLVTGQRVQQILINHGRVQGVLVTDGELVTAPIVVSNADYLKTIDELLPPDGLPKAFRGNIGRRSLSGTVLSVSLGLNRPVPPIGEWPEPNLLYSSKTSGKHEPWFERLDQPPTFDSDEVWIHRPSVHDPGLAPPGKEVVVLRVNASYETFERFRGRKRAHTGDYYPFKKELGERLVARASDLLPELGDAVEYMDVATPLTFEFWGHRTRGSVAGWAWTDTSLEDLSAPPVEGLFIVGLCSYSQLFRGGMGTSLHSGLQVASRILSKRLPQP